jgi:membrane protease YdiL (CAAX protease family)
MTLWSPPTQSLTPVRHSIRLPLLSPARFERLGRLLELIALFLLAPIIVAWLPLTHPQRLGLLTLVMAATAFSAFLRRTPLCQLGLSRHCTRVQVTPCTVTGLFLGLTLLGSLLAWRAAHALPILDPYSTNPHEVLTFACLYPLWAAAQEWLSRAWFFHRYEQLLPRTPLILLNALCFGLLHTCYGHWQTVALSTAAGLLFAHLYNRYRSLLGVSLLHTIAGASMFLFGFGKLFNV